VQPARRRLYIFKQAHDVRKQLQGILDKGPVPGRGRQKLANSRKHQLSPSGSRPPREARESRKKRTKRSRSRSNSRSSSPRASSRANKSRSPSRGRGSRENSNSGKSGQSGRPHNPNRGETRRERERVDAFGRERRENAGNSDASDDESGPGNAGHRIAPGEKKRGRKGEREKEGGGRRQTVEPGSAREGRFADDNSSADVNPEGDPRRNSRAAGNVRGEEMTSFREEDAFAWVAQDVKLDRATIDSLTGLEQVHIALAICLFPTPPASLTWPSPAPRGAGRLAMAASVTPSIGRIGRS
jgi:hypothetical protein